MQASDVNIGAEYALREPPRAGVEFQRVRVLEQVRSGRWKVEWIDPNPGLVDYVKSGNLVVPWKQRRALERDEEHHAALTSCSCSQWDGPDSPVSQAVDLVLEATGEPLATWPAGILSYQPDELARVAARANVEPPSHQLGYSDRHGVHHLPFECALQIARQFAAGEPNTVVSHIDVQERKYETELREPGNSHLLSIVNRWRGVVGSRPTVGWLRLGDCGSRRRKQVAARTDLQGDLGATPPRRRCRTSGAPPRARSARRVKKSSRNAEKRARGQLVREQVCPLGPERALQMVPASATAKPPKIATGQLYLATSSWARSAAPTAPE